MIILAVDLGAARTGLAVCDAGEVLASPIGVIAERDRDRLAEKIAAEVRARGAGRVVVGLPRNMDGTEGDSARGARTFAGQLRTRVSVPVEMRDERGTTITAHGFLNDTDTRGKKRKAVVDAVAATGILEDYLNYRRNLRANGELPV